MNNDLHTGSYISLKVSNENEAKSLLSYMKCKLPNFMLSLRKISQHINEYVCKWIPLLPLNKEWNDEEVYRFFKLSEDDIKLIKETKINGYKDIIPIVIESYVIPILNVITTDSVGITTESIIIKDGRKQYYLVNDKLYKVKRNK
jgi:hypothetical protein